MPKVELPISQIGTGRFTASEAFPALPAHPSVREVLDHAGASVPSTLPAQPGNSNPIRTVLVHPLLSGHRFSAPFASTEEPRVEELLRQVLFSLLFSAGLLLTVL